MRIRIKRICFTPIWMVLFLAAMHGQVSPGSTYHKVKIWLEGKPLSALSEAGIETDHGLIAAGRWLVNDFSEEELNTIRNLGFRYDILQNDVSRWYARQDRPSELSEAVQQRGGCGGISSGGYPYEVPANYTPGSMGGYFTYQEMLAMLDDMIAKYPQLISKRTAIDGFTTYKGNQLFYVRLSDDIDKPDPAEPKVLYTALHHAREPNSLSQMLFYMWYLLENYGKDPVVDRIIQETELYFVPCINPDGYQQNQATNPTGGGMWRKNMWVDNEGNLKGVDLNRNYGYFWGFDNAGSSTNPNSQTFRGAGPFSEPETQAIRQLCLQVPFVLAQNYHTFGNYLIHPWGYNDELTREDALFKALGRVMTRENNYLMGTAMETVGYQVNGVSDDWMYGEIGEKGPIYSFTPEAGPSFWPPSSDIVELNKSCVWMNLSTALLALNYYTAEENVLSRFLTPDFKKLAVNVTRAGLKEGSCQVSLTPLTEGVRVTESTRDIRLKAGETEALLFDLDIDAGRTYTEGIRFLLQVSNDGIGSSTEIVKEWLPAPLQPIYSNPVSSGAAFTTDSWEPTQTCFSPPLAMTDSEPGNYKSKEKNYVTLSTPVDLSFATKAVLTFYARWDIEGQYDYAQVAASIDSIDFIPLCGKYTKPGRANQDFNSPVYDGTRDSWVKEEADLSFFVGNKKVWIRFLMASDEYDEKDGFYFDEIEVLADVPVSRDEVSPGRSAALFPTLIRAGSPLHVVGLVPDEQLIVDFYSAQGCFITSVPVLATSLDLQAENMPAGLVIYRIRSQEGVIGSGKLVVVR